ncbi:hypothetical protein B0H34DRAFT_800582 [Crassisporium funariophilum]|nr:hypothetical protein B0H34DRAFT_800582 [Crassisporium funariophilum]
MSTLGIRPLRDGPYFISSRVAQAGRTVFLHVHASGLIHGPGVDVSGERRTVWFLNFNASNGTYTIWEHGTNNVLDRGREGLTTFRRHGGSNQQWALRLHSGSGLTMTPLSDPHAAITVNGLQVRIESVTSPARAAQLWTFGSVNNFHRTLAAGEEEMFPYMAAKEEENDGCSTPEYDEEAQAQIAQGEKQFAEKAEKAKGI